MRSGCVSARGRGGVANARGLRVARDGDSEDRAQSATQVANSSNIVNIAPKSIEHRSTKTEMEGITKVAHRIITIEDENGKSLVGSREELLADLSIATSGVLNLWRVLPLTEIPGPMDPPNPLPDMGNVQPGEVLVFKWTVNGGTTSTEGGDVLEFTDADRPGFHSTETIDVHTVLSGRVTYRLDTEDVEMAAGDTVIIRGQTHAWANPYEEDSIILVTVIGARRSDAR